MHHATKILIIDPNKEDVKQYKSYLQEGFQSDVEFLICDTAEQAQEITERELVDCILLEYALTGPNGISFLQAMGYFVNTSLPPVIMLTDNGSESIAVQALKQGVSDYIVKSECSQAVLMIAVSDALETREYNLKVRERARKLRKISHYDSLTELPNRVLFETGLERALSRGERYNRLVGVMLINLDNLIKINDVYGFEMGDLLIAELAVRFERCIRKSDTLASLGGNNFAILLEEIKSSKEASIVAERIYEELSIPIKIRSHVVNVEVSIGIAIYPEAGNTTAIMMRNADAAMYFAKSKGGNAFEYYTRDLESKDLQRLTLESALPSALEHNEFYLCYQPIVEMPTGRILGMESLIRWEHPTRGLISPARFIPMAEKTGLIWPIGEWIIQQACNQCSEWHKQGITDKYITINLSACQLSAGELPRYVKHIFEQAKIPPKSIKFELTESAVMSNPRLSEGYLRKLNEMGCKVLLDDFGTGFSSLELLRFLPISGLKISHDFIRDVLTKDSDMKIVKSVLQLGQSLDMMVIAEGIESEEQREALMMQRCKYGQGNLFSKPLRADAMTELLLSSKK